MKLVVGLGNPGREYVHSRHNAGFMVAEELARRSGVPFGKRFWFPARLAACRIGSEEVRILKPTTYMNRSGQAVWSAMRKWKVDPAGTVVVYDDIDLDFGSIRVRARGSGGSHNGMKSVLDWLQTEDFPRVRVGIGPKAPETDMIEYVLGNFPAEESLKLEKVVERAADAVESIFSVGMEQTMNAFNRPKAL